MADVMKESAANESFVPEEKTQHYTQVFFEYGNNRSVCINTTRFRQAL